MKAGQFTNEQIVTILQEAEQEAEKGERPILALCKDKGISEATFYAWRKRFGGLQTRDVQRLRELEKENARLKRLRAERDLELDIVKEALSKNWGALPRNAASSPSRAGVVCASGGPAVWPGSGAPWHATECGHSPWTRPNWWSA